MLEEEKTGVPVLEQAKIASVTVMSGCLHGDAVFYNVKFEHLHSILSSLYPTKMIDTAFPPKQYKLLVSHYTPEFIEERKILLNNYFSKCLVLVEVFKSSEFIEFMNTDKIEDFEPVVANPYIIPLTEELPDDLEVTEINLPAVRYMSDHVLFQVDVVNCRKRKTFQKWTVLKRYGQFWEMDVSLRESLLLMGNDLVKFLPIFPPRKVKLLQDHMEPSFVEMRRALLENYLRQMSRILEVVRSKIFLEFLGAV